MPTIDLKKTLRQTRQLQFFVDGLVALLCLAFFMMVFQFTENKAIQQTQSNRILTSNNPALKQQLHRFITLPATVSRETEAWQLLNNWTYRQQVHTGLCILELIERNDQRAISMQCDGLGQTTPKQTLNPPPWESESLLFTNKKLVNAPKTQTCTPAPKTEKPEVPQGKSSQLTPYGEYFSNKDTLIFEPEKQSWGKQP